MQTLRIFISSPSDVQPERLYAERLIKRLSNEFSESVTLEAYFWEYEPMQLAESFQPQIKPQNSVRIIDGLSLLPLIKLRASGTSRRDRLKLTFGSPNWPR